MSIDDLGTRLRLGRRAAAIAPIAFALAFPLSAQAIDPGVNYDPGSPSGKEYAIPLVHGRAVGAGTSDQRAAANVPFGSGIEPPGGGGSAPATGTRHGSGTGKTGKTGKGTGTNGSRGSAAVLSAKERSRLLSAEEPGGTGLMTVGIALAVLLPALLVAALLRRRPEQPAG
jgi:hypothetical protein